MCGSQHGQHRRDVRKTFKAKTVALVDPKIFIIELGVSFSLDCILSPVLFVVT